MVKRKTRLNKRKKKYINEKESEINGKIMKEKERTKEKEK